MKLLEISQHQEPILLEFIIVNSKTEKAEVNVNGRKYEIRLNHMARNPDVFLLAFSLIDEEGRHRQDTTGTGSSVKVFSKVIGHVLERLEEKGAGAVYFDGNTDEPSRISLYDRICKRLEQRGWDYKKFSGRSDKHDYNYTRFVLMKPDLSNKERSRVMNTISSD